MNDDKLRHQVEALDGDVENLYTIASQHKAQLQAITEALKMLGVTLADVVEETTPTSSPSEEAT